MGSHLPNIFVCKELPRRLRVCQCLVGVEAGPGGSHAQVGLDIGRKTWWLEGTVRSGLEVLEHLMGCSNPIVPVGGAFSMPRRLIL